MKTHDGHDYPVRTRIAAYGRRAKLLRQIHSNKASRAQVWHQAYLMVTLILATVVTLFGFVGTKRLADGIDERGISVSQSTVEVSYAGLVLLILLVTLLGLIFRHDERKAKHYHSVEILTEFIRDCEDVVSLSNDKVATLGTHDLDVFRTRYKGILVALPENTDREYARAKRDAERKTGMQADAASPAWVQLAGGSAEPELCARLTGILLESDERVAMLMTIRDVLGEKAWLVGGAVREAVWDSIHGFPLATQLDDIDVVYFSKKMAPKRQERRMTDKLVSVSPNVKWSVKNEARMHVVAGDAPYKSISDAVSRFPETASAVAVRLLPNDALVILAPYGLNDLFGLIVRPTPGFNATRFNARLLDKNWTKTWPRLAVTRVPLPQPRPRRHWRSHLRDRLAGISAPK